MFFKDADNTPKFKDGSNVVVAGKPGVVAKTEEDGRVVVRFSNGRMQAIEPDKVEAVE